MKGVIHRKYVDEGIIRPDGDVKIDDHIVDAFGYALINSARETEKKEKKQMFFKKLWKAINKIEERVQSQGKIIVGDGVHNSSNPGLSSRLWDLEAKTEVEYIDCHTCGCVVRKEIAFRSNDHTVLEIYLTLKPDESSTHEEVVHETWYCKLHKKGKKAYGSE